MAVIAKREKLIKWLKSNVFRLSMPLGWRICTEKWMKILIKADTTPSPMPRDQAVTIQARLLTPLIPSNCHPLRRRSILPDRSSN